MLIITSSAAQCSVIGCYLVVTEQRLAFGTTQIGLGRCLKKTISKKIHASISCFPLLLSGKDNL